MLNPSRLALYRPHLIIIQLDYLAKDDPRSQEELTAADGISRAAWLSWVQGKRSPGLDHIALRAATFNRQIILGKLNPEDYP